MSIPSEIIKPTLKIVKKQKRKLVLVDPSTVESSNIKNRGTGAGGSNTNKNGLSYEKKTDLDDMIMIISTNKDHQVIKFVGYDKCFMKTKQANFFKCMKDHTDSSVEKLHGCKHPDECYIDKEAKNIFIIEKKFQRGSGSNCEKLQTAPSKRDNYSETFPGFNIIYMYCLSDWFEANCKGELKVLNDKNIPYFWGSSKTYKDDIINFIINYKDSSKIFKDDIIEFITNYKGSSEIFKDDIYKFITNYKGISETYGFYIIKFITNYK